MALAHEPARGGLPEGLYGGAMGSLVVGERAVFPGAQARGAERAVTLADGSAIAERRGALPHCGVADAQDH
jgi:hypothetical protein